MSYFQRVRIWCKRILRLMGCRLRAELLNEVGSYGYARYSFLSARFSGIQVVPRNVYVSS